MKVLVLGGTGMLGHQLALVLNERMSLAVSVRGGGDLLTALGLPADRIVSGVSLDGADVELRVADLLSSTRPDVVVNAVGALKGRDGRISPVQAVRLNCLLPHVLARACADIDARLIAISTDCVFSGDQGAYREDAVPDARDMYGRSKLVGEVGPPHLTLRTSIIGRELTGTRGLLEWFLSNRDGRAVAGYPNAIFSGLPTRELAVVVAEVISAWPDLEGVYHVAAAPINKLALLKLFNEGFEAGNEIHEDESVRIDRSLDGSRFAKATGYVADPWPELVKRMVASSRDVGYDRIRTQVREG